MTITTLHKTPQPTSTTNKSKANQTALPNGTEVRGFALYVGIDDVALAQDGTNLEIIINSLRETLTKISPSAQTHASVAIAPLGAGGRNIDVTRIALGEPTARAKRKREQEYTDNKGVILDIARHHLLIEGTRVRITQREFEILKFFIQNSGIDISRTELISSIWAEIDESETPNERTVDVHIRRLRTKLHGFADIIRTVRGVGYRFDKHPDVHVIGL